MRSLVLFGLLLIATPAAAQSIPVSGAESLGWDQDAPDQATVDAYGFNVYVDGVIDSTLSATCVAGTVLAFECSALLPALTPGPHVLEVTAFVPTVNGDVESLPSNSLPLLVTVAPSAPQNLRIFD